jgi:hypothetical protein
VGTGNDIPVVSYNVVSDWYTCIYIIMKRRFKQWWLSIPPMSTQRTFSSHLNSLNTKKNTIYDVWNLGLGQAQNSGEVKPVNGIPTLLTTESSTAMHIQRNHSASCCPEGYTLKQGEPSRWRLFFIARKTLPWSIEGNVFGMCHAPVRESPLL